MRKEPRPYQDDAIKSAIEDLKASPEPVLLELPTGAGKTLINSFLAEFGSSMGFNVLCISSFSELIAQNAEEFIEQGNNCSIFCASLSSKKWRNPVVMGTPMSIWSAINAGHQLKSKPFGLILIDEVHRVNMEDENSVYFKILKHYKELQPDLRICGFTGTPYRGGSIPIYGEGKMFPKLNYSIKFSDLVEMGYLNPPVFGIHKKEDDFDFSGVKQNKLGNFDKKGLQKVVGDNSRTTKVMLEVIEHTQESYGVFIFCATIEQCQHVMKMLPPDSSRLITGTMAEKARIKAMNEAKAMKVKFLVNVNVLTTGINIPHYDTIVYLRLTESAVFFVQSIGRGSRLCEKTNKKFFTVLDYAGNCDRFKGINDKTLAAAVLDLEDEDKEVALDIICPDCSTLNSIHDRRCRGFSGSERCSYMFVFRECPTCRCQCDISARTCCHCGEQLHDYNKQLKLKAYSGEKTVFDIVSMHTVKHFNFKAKRDIVKVVMLTDCDTTICMYFDPNGTKWQQDEWKAYLVEQGMPSDMAAPKNIRSILKTTILNFKKPSVVEATKNGPYYSVIKRIYEN